MCCTKKLYTFHISEVSKALDELDLCPQEDELAAAGPLVQSEEGEGKKEREREESDRMKTTGQEGKESGGSERKGVALSSVHFNHLKVAARYLTIYLLRLS